MEITMEPIGYVRSAYKEPGELPRWDEIADVRACIEIEERFAEGIADITPGDRLMVLFHFHKAPEARLTVPLMGVGPMVGVFSSHSPTRPNFIGVTEVEVESVDGLQVGIKGADMLDGTPVLDLKPVPTRTER